MIKWIPIKRFIWIGLLLFTGIIFFGCHYSKNPGNLSIAEDSEILDVPGQQETAALTDPPASPAPADESTGDISTSSPPKESPLLTRKKTAQQVPPLLGSQGESYILVYKARRILQLWQGEEMIGEYDIALGFEPVGHKGREGDGKTPEGEYYVCMKNPNSKYYLSLGVSYPGIPDAQRGLERGLITQDEHDKIVRAIDSGGTPPWNTALGGQIMIHGCGSHADWTEGCIAVENQMMDILWESCNVGTQIVIYP